VLRSGQAYTPFALLALLEASKSDPAIEGRTVDAALTFIRRSVDRNGSIGLGDPDILEYPNYATAYALRCLVRAGRAEDRPLATRLTTYLLGQQLVESRGILPDSPAYGAWGFGAPLLRPGDPGHVDISHTRAVLQALHEVGHNDPGPFRKAEAFLRMAQKHPTETRRQPYDGPDMGRTAPPRYDGGFYFSPVVLGANKGLTDPGDETHGPGFRSYASATCDGVLALVAVGTAPNDERLASADRWLESYHDLHRPEGIPEIDPEPWHLALHYYHLAGRACAYAALGRPGNWREAIIRILASEQQPDGSFLNTHCILMKEDDPILATSLAVTALAHATT
jgi:hypothetical protein